MFAGDENRDPRQHGPRITGALEASLELVAGTWNTRFFSQWSGGLRSSDALIRRCAWALAGMEDLPAVLALQEVEGPSLRAGGVPVLERFLPELHRALDAHRRPVRYHASWHGAHRVGGLVHTGLALLVADPYRVEEEPAVVELRRGVGPVQRRLAVEARIVGPSRPFRFVGLHLGLPRFRHGPRYHLRMGECPDQVRQVEVLLEHLEGCEDPVVLAGDFNAEPGSAAVRALEAAGFVDAWPAHARREGHPPRGTASFLHLDLHLDHLFVRGLGVQDVTLGSTRTGPFAGLSDHAPLVARLV